MGTVNTILIVLLVMFVVLAVHLILTYNNLVMVKNNVALAWANIDVLLKQRHDEIPKLVEVCKQYMQFEQETLVRVAEARSRVASAREARNIDALGPAEVALRAGVAKVFALAEAYPALKANQNFLQLQSRIAGLENAIADRREFYNDSANVNNIRIQQFPDAIIARVFRFKEADMLDFEAQELVDVDVRSLFGPNAKGKAA
jgi:LemA protein